ncbi:MAG: ABC transporter ATP-binding protein [Treponema sp.]|nr:ABC transporter ATP-binding protein [Treponema sp.]
MTNKQELVKHIKQKNRLPNIMLCIKITLDIIPHIVLLSLIRQVFTSTLSNAHIYSASGIFLACFICKAACTYMATWKAHEAAYNCLTELRLQIVKHLKKLSLGFFQMRKTGDLTNIVEHDVEQVEVYLAHGLPEIMSATLLPTIVFIVMLLVDWRLAIAMIVGVPLSWLTKKISTPLWKKNTKIFFDSVTKMQEDIMEYVATIPVIKAFGKEETKTEKALQSIGNYDYWVKKAMAGVSAPLGLIALFMESGVALVIIFGTYFLANGEIALSRLILSIILGTLFTSSIAKIATYQHYGIVFNQAMKSIDSVINAPATKRPVSTHQAENGDIAINNVSFSYDGKETILENISLSFKKGSTTALVGASGCGKSTLANMLMGFWEPTAGTISVAGKNIASLSEKQLNSLFSIVQQDVFLFNVSMEENIRIGNPLATMEDIVEAAKKARIHNFIMSLPRGYKTLAGEAGIKFSGGEKQRISIARMILKDAPIIILDEATAAVDAENETHIQAAIDVLSKNKTVITIAHHLDTIKTAQQIVVMDSGRVIDTGTHNELMARCALYKKMVVEQRKVDNWKIKDTSPQATRHVVL